MKNKNWKHVLKASRKEKLEQISETVKELRSNQETASRNEHKRITITGGNK